MIDTVIVSGGMIQKDFALDFIRKIEEERKGKKLLLPVYQVLERHIWRVLTIQKLSD